MTRKIIYKNLNETTISLGGRRSIIRNVIKENTIALSSSISVGGEQPQLDDKTNNNSHKHEIEPIIENDEVVGVVHHCQCGKSTEIRFDY